MSVHMIYYQDGAKKMRPVLSREEYLSLRDSETNRSADKLHMVQMNYSCLPNEDGTLKGSTHVSSTVGMDIDTQIDVSAVLSKKEELGLLMLEKSATKGFHIVFRRRPELSQEENLLWASDLLGIEFDKGAKDITRVFFTPADKLLYLDDAIFTIEEVQANEIFQEKEMQEASNQEVVDRSQNIEDNHSISYLGIPYDQIISKWWELYNDGKEPVTSNRDVLTFELAVNLRHIAGFDRAVLDKIIPCYDGFPEVQKMKCIDSALAEKRTQMPRRIKDVLSALRIDRLKNGIADDEFGTALDEAFVEDEEFFYRKLPRMPLGVKDSIDAVGPAMAMPILTAICPAIGALATGVSLDVHGTKRNLNLTSYIVGDFGTGKSGVDPVIEAWMSEQRALDKIYLDKEAEWRTKKSESKNKKEQPVEIKYPIRYITLNNTLANISERLANTQNKHAFSFSPEAETVAQKWRSSIGDFSVMVRQSYDGSPYEREARSVDAVNVHIPQLLWNIVLCGTPDVLYGVVSNYTNGLQSRIGISRMPDNTFVRLDDNPRVLTERQKDHIQQVAHLLPLISGEIVLPKLEKRGREWLEKIRLETIKNDDKVKARQRIRTCVTTQRMVCCLMLCRVCEILIQKYGISGAEAHLNQNPDLWKEMIVRTQTPSMLETFDVLADSLIENALFFFRDRIENAYNSKDYVSSAGTDRVKHGKNDTIYSRLESIFTFDQAFQNSSVEKGSNVTRNSVQQMLKNWRIQGLIQKDDDGRYRKLTTV